MKYFKLKGFTLIELVVVIAAVIVISGLLVSVMIGIIEKVKYTKQNTNAKKVYNVINEFQLNSELYGYSFDSYYTSNIIKISKSYNGEIKYDGKANGKNLKNFLSYKLKSNKTCYIVFGTGANGEIKWVNYWEGKRTPKPAKGDIVGCYPQNSAPDYRLEDVYSNKLVKYD